MGFNYSNETKKTLSETFDQVKGKNWEFFNSGSITPINTMKEFSKALGECMADAVCDDELNMSYAWSTDDELATAACKIMKNKLGL